MSSVCYLLHNVFNVLLTNQENVTLQLVDHDFDIRKALSDLFREYTLRKIQLLVLKFNLYICYFFVGSRKSGGTQFR